MPKAIKALKTFKGSRSIKPNPFTPVRRLFFKLDRLRPGNRQRAARYGNPEPDPVVDTPPESPVASTSQATRACMALQNDDLTEDAVVITALSTLPFCCHEDLLTMPRRSLVAVAESLNTRLPAVLHISVARMRTDAAIRNEIEFVVGLRTEMAVPPAPRAPRANYVHEVDVDDEMDRTPPTSPLSRRGRKLFQIHGTPGTPRLGRLTEEEEEEDLPMKLRCTQTTVKEADDAMDVDLGTPTPIPTRLRARVHRSLSEHVPASPIPHPRNLRSHSTKLPAEIGDMKIDMGFIDTAFVNSKRPKYRKRENTEIGGQRRATQPALIRRTSTPKQKVRAVSATVACRPFFALAQESTSMSLLTSHESVESSPVSLDSDRVRMNRRRNSIEVEKKMALGMIGLNMGSGTN